ncbi:MAG: LCP family protein [Actinobacteria bacterium]|nr:LCP family protein [Actinomycetota bacterium]
MPSPPTPSWPRVAVVVAAVVALALAWVGWTWWSAERALDQQEVGSIDDRGTEDAEAAAFDEVLDVLVVGSDDRSDLTEEQRRELHTGTFDGARTDTILWVQLRGDGVSIVSFPRDLLVRTVDDGNMRINQVLEVGGPDALAGVVEGILGAELDHYVEVSISSFLEIVDAAGGVEICLDEELRDRKSGADFDAGCHDMDGVDALAYVRSRQGDRSDFARVERQQIFLTALADKATSLSVLANPVRLRSLATTVAEGLTVDDGLGVPRMVDLARAMQGVLDEGLDSFTLPAYPMEVDGIPYVVPYEPGVAELSGRIARGEELPDRPTQEERDELDVRIVAGASSAEASRVESVLYFAGYSPAVGGTAEEPVRTTVHAGAGAGDAAEAIAAVLGARLSSSPPSDLELGFGEIVVVTGAGVGTEDEGA